jgi:hypothetical protein
MLGFFYESEFEILGSRYPTSYPAAGNEGVLDAAPYIPTFFSHRGSSRRQGNFIHYGAIYRQGMIPKPCFLRNSSHNPNYFGGRNF